MQIQDEFVTFMRAYQDMVFSTAARISGNDAQAEDISQEVFLKAYEHFAELRASNTAGGWLKTVTTRLALNHLSRYRRRWRLFSELGSQQADEQLDSDSEAYWAVADTLVADIDAQTRQALIEQALRDLPERYRVPLVLYHFEELPYVEIARELKVSLPKLKTDIQRGRAAMAKLLARRGVLRPSGEQ